MAREVGFAWIFFLFKGVLAIFVLLDDVEHFMVEQIVEDSICCANNHVAEVHLT
jgi:hypothetical protein